MYTCSNSLAGNLNATRAKSRQAQSTLRLANPKEDRYYNTGRPVPRNYGYRFQSGQWPLFHMQWRALWAPKFKFWGPQRPPLEVEGWQATTFGISTCNFRVTGPPWPIPLSSNHGSMVITLPNRLLLKLPDMMSASQGGGGSWKSRCSKGCWLNFIV